MAWAVRLRWVQVREGRLGRSRNVDDKRSGLIPGLAFSENPLPARVREGSRAMLSEEQVATFRRDGVLVAGNAVDSR